MPRGKLNIHRNWTERAYKSGRIRRFVRVWSRMLINNQVDYKKACNVYKRNEANPVATIRKLLRRKEVQLMIEKEIIKLYEKESITPSEVVKIEKDLFKKTLKASDYTNSIKLLKAWRDSLGMAAPKVTKSESYEERYSMDLRAIEKLQKKFEEDKRLKEEQKDSKKLLDNNKDN
ncbi:hypothetical protein ACFLS9_01230 [Bacteroidota bacterium]